MTVRIPTIMLAAGVALPLAGMAARAADNTTNAGAAPATASPISADALYSAVAIVTGTRAETRGLGFAQALGDVLVKLTGDQTIVRDPHFAAFAARAADYVERFRYRDRKEGKPLIDEQGTYDRPHDLTVVFDHEKIDALARELGREPWAGPRPRVVVFVGVDNISFANGVGTPHSYMLASDAAADKSADMREAFAAAALKAGLPVAFPTLAQLGARGYTPKTVVDAEPADLATIARADGGDVAVAGRMVFSEQTLGWVTSWRMVYQGKAYGWGERGVNFDQAFRNALFGAAQIVTGHGAPQ
jgi:uncharacterized protein